MLGNLLGGFIVILVGVNLIPSIADGVAGARYINGTASLGTNSSYATGAAGTIIGLVPLFYALGIMSAGVALTVGGLRNAGVM